MMHKRKRKQIKGILKWTIMASLSVVMLYFAFKGVAWSDFVQGLSNCNYWWILASMAIGFLANVVRGIRWRLLLLPLDEEITGKRCYDGVAMAYLTNFALPRAGELARCGVVAQRGKVTFESALGSVVLERSIDMLSFIIILSLVVVCNMERLGGFIMRDIFGVAASDIRFSFILALAAVAVTGLAFGYLLYRYRERLSRYKVMAKFYEIVGKVWDGLVAGFKSEHKTRFLFWTVILWICYWLSCVFTINAMSVQLSASQQLGPVDALFMMVVGGLGWIVPVQGGIGAYHFVVSLALASIYGIAQNDGVIFATISHESQSLMMIVFGLISMISLSIESRNTDKPDKPKTKI